MGGGEHRYVSYSTELYTLRFELETAYHGSLDYVPHSIERRISLLQFFLFFQKKYVLYLNNSELDTINMMETVVSADVTGVRIRKSRHYMLIIHKIIIFRSVTAKTIFNSP